MEFVEFLLKHEMSINQNTVFIFFIRQFYEATTHITHDRRQLVKT